MKKTTTILIILTVLLTACSSIPQEYKNHPCADFCYPSGNVDPKFSEILNEVQEPICKKIPNYQPEQFETGGAAGRISIICEGEDSYCDCLLNDGSTLIEKISGKS